MTDNAFDKFVRNSLRNHSAPVPAGMWDKVNPAPKDNDRIGGTLPRNYLYGLLVGMLVTAGLVMGYLLLRENSTTEIKAVVAQTTAKQDSATYPAHAHAITGDTIPITDQHPAIVKHEPSLTQDEQTAPPLLAKPSQSTSKQISRKGEWIQGIEQQNNNSTDDKNRSILANSTNTNFTGSPNLVDISNKTHQNQEAHASLVQEIKVQEEQENTYAAALSSKQLEAGLFIYHKLHYKPFTNTRLDSIDANYANKVRDLIICPPYSRGNTDWFAEIYVSPDLAFRSVRNVSATPQYMQRKDSSESMQVGYSAGIRIVKPITDQLLVKAGLQYTQMNERFKYRTENEVRTTTVITLRTIVRGPGDTLRISDTSSVQQVGYQNHSIRNRYRSIDIPVTVGYQWGNENWKIGVNAGVVVNLSSWYQGVMLDPSTLNTTPVTKGNNGMYKSNIGLGLYGGISVLKPLGEHTQLFFEPYFRYNLGNVTNAQAPFQQKFSIGGLSIGLRYNLNR